VGKQYRALFISDVHLGTKACQADDLIAFLRRFDADTYYLVGDIVDFWRIKCNPHWPQSHNDVIQKLLRKVRKGARCIYVPGNHDDALRAYCGQRFGGIEFQHTAIHVAADGRRFLVTHGDTFDTAVSHLKRFTFMGDWVHACTTGLNSAVNRVRTLFGFPYWSVSSYLKHKVKKAVNYISDFEEALAAEARRHKAEGVICGHIHHAATRDIDGISYINCGDWVENASVVAETFEGEFEIIRWSEVLQAEEAETQAAVIRHTKAAA
jgi:UDP-2,3-diacylglucosamine pyrophosphatase LpxH